MQERVALVAVLDTLLRVGMQRLEVEEAAEKEGRPQKLRFASGVSRAASVNSSAARCSADIFDVSMTGRSSKFS